jgi:hypothetical protein
MSNRVKKRVLVDVDSLHIDEFADAEAGEFP